jgi:hypothetical protein
MVIFRMLSTLNLHFFYLSQTLSQQELEKICLFLAPPSLLGEGGRGEEVSAPVLFSSIQTVRQTTLSRKQHIV